MKLSKLIYKTYEIVKCVLTTKISLENFYGTDSDIM